MKDGNSLDPEFVKTELDKVDKILNNIICEHHWFGVMFDELNHDPDEFLRSLGMAHDWLRQAQVYYEELQDKKNR